MNARTPRNNPQGGVVRKGFVPGVLLFALLLAGCAATPGEPEVVIQPSGPGQATVDFELDPPVTELNFTRTATRARLRQWEVLDPDVVLQGDALHSTSPRERFDHARIRIHAEDRRLYREYPPLVPMADGGLLVHTGLLIPAEVDRIHLYLEADGWHTAIPGHKPDITAVVDRLDPQNPTGIWVYIGPEPAQETEYGMLVIDPALPKTLADTVAAQLESAHAFFSERMGAREIPLLAAAHHRAADEAALEGDFTRGPALRLAIGAPEAVRAADVRPPELSEQRLAHLIGHEMGHRWNSDLIRPTADPAAAWMAEGSSELFALRLTEQLGLRDEAEREAWIGENLDECREVLERRPLAEITPPEPDYRAHYSCGLAFALLTEQAFAEGDIFVFWQLMNHLFHEEDAYLPENYLGVLAEHGGRETAAAIARMIRDPRADRAAILDEQLKTTGVRP